MSDHCLPTRAVTTAQLLTGAVRDRDPDTIAQLLTGLTRDDDRALIVTLAAMVPVDQSPTELLAWCDSSPVDMPRHSPRVLQPHGTHAAHVRHRNNGEAPCEACVLGEADYQRGRHRRRQLAAASS